MDRPQISRVFRAALTRDAHERARFLAEACAGDDELRRQVEALLAGEDAATGVIEVTPQRAAPAPPSTANLPFASGQLARYRIIEKLGAGGMGEVHKARDEQLDRDVAIKVLPASSFEDPTARARLVHEAKAAAALNHPHICTIYEVGEADGHTYIAMELVGGQPLSARLKAGALSPDQVVHYGLQLADALAHAHESGVIHRDLKSANVMVRPDGRVKVLDFGLAKRLTATELTMTITRDVSSLTEPGTVMGTLAYMAPEQLRGQPAQTSSDVWALGVVLHELAAGRRPFEGQTGFEVSAAILSGVPAPLPSEIPRPLQTVIRRCLEKEPGQRYQVGSEVRAALEAIHAGADVPTAATEMRSAVVPSTAVPPARVTFTRRRAIGLGAAAVVAIAAGLASWLWPDAPVRSLAVLPFENLLNDEESDYLGDGIAEGLIRQVSRLPSLDVAPLSAVLNFKGQTVDPGDVRMRQLGVETVLLGAYSLEGDRLSVTAELVDTDSGAQLWSNTYDGDFADLLTVQEKIANAILDELLRLEQDSDERQLVRRPTDNGEAYDFYLQARYLQRLATEDDYLIARDFLDRAVQRDPEFALAYLALAGTHAMMAVDGFERPSDAQAQFSSYLGRALAIDPDLVEARSLAHTRAFYFDWDWEGAERERLRMLQASAGEFDPDALRTLALERRALGRPDEALELASRARELDPLSTGLSMLEGLFLDHAGRLDDAIVVYERIMKVEPDNPDPYLGLAEVLHQQGRFDEASEARRRAHTLLGTVEDDFVAGLFAAARGEQGYREAHEAYVRLQLEWLREREIVGYASPLDFARAYAELGESEQAFDHLDRAFIDRSPGLVELNVDRAWDRIRDEPQFLEAVRKVGLPLPD